MKTLKVIGFISIFLGIIILFFTKSCEKHKEKRANEKAEIINNNAKSIEHNYTYKIINFSGEYGEIVYLPGGNKFVFLNASEPFCVINSDGSEVCGEKGEDPDIGKSSANKKLRFKSQNRKEGTIVIKSWTK